MSPRRSRCAHCGATGLLHAATTIYPLEDAVSAYHDLAHGEVTGRAVVVPNDTFTP